MATEFDLVVRGNIVDAHAVVNDGWIGVRGGKVAARGSCDEGAAANRLRRSHSPRTTPRSSISRSTLTEYSSVRGVRVLRSSRRLEVSTIDTGRVYAPVNESNAIVVIAVMPG